ncbi:hypothetical protein [uncultured Xylophilus sp.]|uniref:hypothetical protein n=1 Tax=uncultured Xylophilus sp. TaxID=296832 RepID=UPI0025F89428|nr:hypothetical protein [uncultured Xylophilus sp.]
MFDRKPSLTRWRTWAVLVLPALVILGTALLSPDGWRDPLVKCIGLAWSALAVALTHSARTALFDYVQAGQAWRKSLEGSTGAGLSFLGICVVTAALFLGLVSFARAQPLPPGAVALGPAVLQEIDQHWPDIPRRSYVGALIEKETCITLRHPYCWSTAARLKTAREEGAGLGQLTRAWAADGSLRFDALAEVRALAPAALRDLTWATVYQRADLGVRAILVKLRHCDRRLQQLGVADDMARVAFCDAGYNGGDGGVQSERRACGLVAGCDPDQWFGHVERHCLKSRAKWQGYGDSACDINRKHVAATVPIEPRRVRYVALLGV